MQEVYKIQAICKRCDFSGEIEIKKGNMIENENCGVCGCAGSMEKEQKIVITNLRYNLRDYT